MWRYVSQLTPLTEWGLTDKRFWTPWGLCPPKFLLGDLSVSTATINRLLPLLSLINIGEPLGMSHFLGEWPNIRVRVLSGQPFN